MSDTAPAEVQRLIDEKAVADVAIRYCWALDENDWDALTEVFLPDATANLGGTSHDGLADITDRIRTALGPLDESQHLVGDHQVVIDGDEATHRCYLHAQHVKLGAEGGPHYIVAGRYEDRMVRTPAGWRIEHRDLIIMWTEGNPKINRRPR